MEIDYIILWKEKVEDKTNIHSKVLEMLKTIFPNTNSSVISFQESADKIHTLPYQISSNTDDTVYLKLECNYSEAKAAEVLSVVRDKITQGKYRSDFSIIFTYDEASLSYCCRLMRPFGVFERRLREIMYFTTVKAFGYNWVAKTFPEELKKQIADKTHGLSDEKITEKAFEYLDYSEISSYLFDKRRWCGPLDDVFDEELSDERINDFSKEEIANIIRKTRIESLWSKLFSSNERLINIEQKIKFLQKYRNDTMHHHTMTHETFKKVQSELRKINSELSIAVSEIECKIYTKEEFGSILSLVEPMLTRIIDGFSAFYNSICNIGEVVVKAVEMLSSSFSDIAISNLSLALESLEHFSFPNISLLADHMTDLNITYPRLPVSNERKKYYVIKIQEREYSCEDVPNGWEPMCDVLVRDENNQEKWIKLSEKYLSDNEIGEGDVIEL